MAQDVSANGVQVVGGSNPPCPTKLNPNRTNEFAAFILLCARAFRG